MSCIKIGVLESILHLRVWLKLQCFSVWIKFSARDIHINLLGFCEFCETWSSENIILGVGMNWYLHFLRLLSDFGDISFRCSVHNCVGSVLWVSWKSGQGSLYFFCGRNGNYVFTCAMKQFCMLDVKNTLVKSFILCHRVHHLQRCVLSEEYLRDVSARLELKV